MVVEAYEKEKMKFSSECLEILLKKNYMNASGYLLENYYPKTSIDTEIIVKSVANEIQRNQDYLIFQVRQKMLGEGQQFPSAPLMIYWAQSVEEIFVKIKLHDEVDAQTCKQTFERQVLFDYDMLRVQAFCMEIPRDVTSGVKKNEHASKTQKEFDLDRNRDDPTVLEINSLKEEGFSKK